MDPSTSLFGWIHFQFKGYLVYEYCWRNHSVREIQILNANNVDPDQTPCVAVYGLELHCLPMSLLRDDRYKWVKCLIVVIILPHESNRYTKKKKR